jgi:GTPase SAR1 family protein
LTLDTAALKAITDNLTILLFGNTGSGKTALIGELTEHLYKTKKQTARLYTADLGGWKTIEAYAKLGILDVQMMFGDPWVWLDHAIKGDRWDGSKWVSAIDPKIGLYAYESMTSIASAVMKWMADASARGISIGGGGAMNFVAGDKEKIKIGSNNMAHYGVAQSQVYEKSTQSQQLPGTVLWTAGDSQSADDSIGGVVGPQIAGKAKTSEVPSWFKYTFHLTVDVQPGAEPVHVLHTAQHIEMASKGMSMGMSNARIPLSGGSVEIPAEIRPASLVKALELIEKRQDAAVSEIAKRLGL